jgi:hypothetical protein
VSYHGLVIITFIHLEEDGNLAVESVEKPLQDILMDIQTPQLQRRGLQCVLGTVGLSGSVMLKAVNTVMENTNKQSKYNSQ